MFPQLTAKLTALVRKRKRLERRAAKRMFPSDLTPCLVRAPGDAEPRAAWLHNLSVRGLGLLTDRGYEPGTRLQVRIVNASHTFCLGVELTVVRGRRILSGDYFLGGEFTRVLDYSELLPFFA
jgi:hypothetical protein